MPPKQFPRVSVLNSFSNPCTQCHSDLRTKEGASKFEASVTSFEKKHPDFRVARGAAKDPGGLKLNHYAHLQPNLIGPNHIRVQMTCFRKWNHSKSKRNQNSEIKIEISRWRSRRAKPYR